MKAAIIGPVSRDELKIGGETYSGMGGVLYYAGNALTAMGAKVTLIASYGEEPEDWIDQLECEYLFHIRAQKTLKYQIEYLDDGKREDSCTPYFQNIELEEILEDDISRHPYIIFAPLLHDHFSYELIKSVGEIAPSSLVLAAQGMIRYVEDGRIVWKNPENVINVLPFFNYVFLDEDELKFIGGSDTLDKAAKPFLDTGLENLIITKNSKGSTFYHHGEKYIIKPFKPKEIVDPTGSGDTYMAAFLMAKQTFKDPLLWGDFASMAATISMENTGPLDASLCDIMGRMNKPC